MKPTRLEKIKRLLLGSRSLSNRKSLVMRYGVMLITVIVAFAITAVFNNLLKQDPFMFCVLAMTFIAWYGGIGPGLTSTVIFVVVINYSYMKPPYWIDFETTDLPRLGLFLIVSLTVNWLEAARKKAENLSFLRQAQLEHLARLTTTSEMAAGIAHELNQPLSAISIYCHGCLGDPQAQSELSPRANEALRRISDQAKRAGQIIANFRKMIRKQKPVRSVQNLHRVINDALELMQFDLRRSHAQLTLDYAPQNLYVICDEVEIGQVVINLAKNALEAMLHDKVVAPTLTLQTRSEGDRKVVISVIDNGKAIDAEQITQIFDPFFTTKENGMGMGLKICRTIIESHGGRIWAKAGDAGGLSLSFSLPLANEDNIDDLDDDRDHPHSPPAHTQPRT